MIVIEGKLLFEDAGGTKSEPTVGWLKVFKCKRK
jgi:hypothetical protein